MATISSHILDSVIGDHARGIRVECYRLESTGRALLFDVTAGADGRIAEPIDSAAEPHRAQYELVFHAADYFEAMKRPPDTKQIMPRVIVRLDLPDPDARYHIPLVLSPHSYTIWWSG
jgi:5-hydroxyisourate hydrolase